MADSLFDVFGLYIGAYIFHLLCFYLWRWLICASGSINSVKIKRYAWLQWRVAIGKLNPSPRLPGNLLVIAFVSYFGAKLHRPKIIGVGCVLMSIGTFIIALPHFITGRWATRIPKSILVLEWLFIFVYSYEFETSVRRAENSTQNPAPCPVGSPADLTQSGKLPDGLVRGQRLNKGITNMQKGANMHIITLFFRLWRRVQPVNVDLCAVGKRLARNRRDARSATWHLLHWWLCYWGKCSSVCW